MAMRVPSPQRLEAGFLYVEVLIGLAIFGMAMLAVVPMFLLGVQGNATAHDLTYASSLAQEKAEALRATAYEDVPAGSGEEIITMRSVNYVRSHVVVEDSPHPGMKTVTVNVKPLRADRPGVSSKSTVIFYHVE